MRRRTGFTLIYFAVIISTLLLRVSTALGLPESIGADGSIYFTLMCQPVIFGALPLACYAIMQFAERRRAAKQGIVLTTGDMFAAFRSDFSVRNTSGRNWMRSIILGVCVIITGSFISYLWQSVLIMMGYSFSSSPDVYNNIGDLFIQLTLTALLPAVFEEFTHRGLLGGAYLETGWRFALISALLFSLMHQNIRQTGYTFIDGAVIALAVYYSGSLFTGIVIHFINNALSVIISYSEQQGGILYFLAQIEDWLYGSVYGIMVFVAIAVAAGLLIAFLLMRMRNDAVKAGRVPSAQFAPYPDGVLPVRYDWVTHIVIAVGVAATLFSFAWGMMR